MNYKYSTFLFPVFAKQKTDYWSYWSLLHIFSGTSIKHSDTGEDKDIMISPLFIWGKGETKKDSYYGFFPFFGKVKSKIGWSEIKFFLFPLYASWQHKDFKAYSILWPIFLYGKSPSRLEHRFLPFYSIKIHKGKYKRYSVLWPFFQWGTDFMDKKEPVSYFMFFPFYAHKRSKYGNMRSYAFLWLPLLGSFIGYGYDKRTGETNFNALFFIYQYGYSKDGSYKKHIFFPFIGYYRRNGKEAFFVTPFYFRLKSNTYHIKSDYKFITPFFWKIKKHYIKEDKTDIYYKLWPFFRYHKNTQGDMEWNILSLFPVRSETAEKVWEPMWSLIEYKKLANGEKRLSLFMRLYNQRWSADEFHVHIPFLWDYSRAPGYVRWKFLMGLIGYERIGDKRKIQLLWFIKI